MSAMRFLKQYSTVNIWSLLKIIERLVWGHIALIVLWCQSSDFATRTIRRTGLEPHHLSVMTRSSWLDCAFITSAIPARGTKNATTTPSPCMFQRKWLLSQSMFYFSFSFIQWKQLKEQTTRFRNYVPSIAGHIVSQFPLWMTFAILDTWNYFD